MKKSSAVQNHPNQEDKTGRPTFASAVTVNFSANESRATEKEHTSQAPQANVQSLSGGEKNPEKKK